ncbi:hypothetical protein EVAR_11866_1 [Eumeta japonica]|uniref:Mos1 transposase HTH domain-containing protein n=1 Tax=Eumeta variegata TaxID=151549 RepID=A0A4C1U8C3_EUMVA|nr:hypothetical protein EVAR_11866_1 [Eumeta japonica]
MILYDFKCHLIVQQSLARLRTAFGDEQPYKTTIYNWFAEFKLGRLNFSDGFRDDCPSTALNNKYIDAVLNYSELIAVRKCTSDPIFNTLLYVPHAKKNRLTRRAVRDVPSHGRANPQIMEGLGDYEAML